MKLRCWLAVLVLAGCPKRPGGDAGRTFDLRFGWTSDLVVEADLSRARGAGGQDEVHAVTARYVLAVTSQGRKLRVAAGAVDVVKEDGPADPLARLAFGAWPAFDVDRRGRFLALASPELARAEVRTFLSGLPPAARSRIEERVESGALGGGAASDWDAIVGRWSGRTMTEGERVRWESKLPLPLLVDDPVRTMVEERLVGAVPCTPEQNETRCVRIASDERVIDDDARRVAELFRDGMAGAAGASAAQAPDVRRADVVFSVDLVTEPDTLVPHEVHQRRSMIVELALGDQAVTLQQLDVSVRRFTRAAAR